ncbi:HD domain-containing protein [Leptolyngbya sp. FACHB-711]|uniref:HD domain-containing protein n=1 Tax=Leptolyngbya sp. FACHB-711 TaxID=2692813 RepID=UPI001682CE90|nr:HD domain-containing protein [Leptolyngbya sp. FACHB-711]MBD2023917.1 HD domain-containing protein [Leptolyngbya sp. FACHB-711]
MTHTPLTDRFEQALVLAHRLHANQVRKVSGIPYIAHLLSVTAFVLEDGGTEDEAIAALLHDAIEDQGGQAIRAEIQTRFGDRVAAIVEGCTDSATVPKPPWKERKQHYLENLRAASPEVVRVSLADKLHNARSLLRDWRKFGSSIWQQFSSDSEQRLWFYQELVSLYKAADAGGMSEEFARTVEDLRDLDRLSLP